jgi:hypothetical protein
LSAATGLATTDVKDIEMTVTWTKKTGATKYMVHHKLTTSSVWTNSAELSDVNIYKITGLSHSTAYLVAVTAINSVGSAVKSSSITVTTNTVDTLAVKTPPEPTKPLVEFQEDNTIKMTFDVPFEEGGSAIIKYVYRVENVDGSLVTSGDIKNEMGRILATEVKTFEFTKDELSMLQSDTIYRFRVAAVNGEGIGAFSDFVTLNFSGWHNPKDDDLLNSSTTAVIIVIVILILVISAIITYYICKKKK